MVQRPFILVKDHVLLPRATELVRADEECRSLLTAAHIRSIVNLVPDEWLELDPAFESVQEQREAIFIFWKPVYYILTFF